MHPLASRPYVKMNGIGNAIVVMDLRDCDAVIGGSEARAIAAREPFDQLMVLLPPRTSGTDAVMQIFNQDGTEAGACGNGTRCVAWYLMPRLNKDRLLLETKTTPRLVVERSGEDFAVDMGRPIFDWRKIPLATDVGDPLRLPLMVEGLDLPMPRPPSALGMGNPHLIIWVDEDPHNLDLARIGPMLERHPLFPDGTNVSLAHVISRQNIKLRVWERGAGLTLACGSAACAVAVAAAKLTLTDRLVDVALPGGHLTIAWRASDDHVSMTGPVSFEHDGAIGADWFSAAA